MLRNTVSPAVDAAVARTISLVRQHFSNPLVAAYLAGSYANGYAVPTSDIDLYLIFEKDLTKEDEGEYDRIATEVEALEPPIDFIPQGLPRLLRDGLDMDMEEHFVHLWGEPVHQRVGLRSIEDYVYQTMHSGYLFLEGARKAKPYVWPLGFPDSTDPYKGYAWRKTRVGGEEKGSIKGMVVMTGWMASGLVAWKGKKYVPTKRECPGLFREVVGGEAARAFQAITDVCRGEFHYLLPETPADSARVQALLPGALLIENYFLGQYQHFLLENLTNESPIRARTSVIRLGEIQYPNQLSLEALERFRPVNDSQLEALAKSLVFQRSVSQSGSGRHSKT